MINKGTSKIFKKISLLLLVTVCINSYSFSQGPYYNWVTTMGSDTMDVGMSITVDNLGNIYACGYFGSTVDFDPSISTENSISQGVNDIFVTKMNVNKELIWVKAFGGIGEDYPREICIDNSGNLIITGAFSGTVDFDPSTQSELLTSNGELDIFILKLDNDGNFIWVKGEGGVGEDVGASITTDSLNNILLIGYFENVADLNPNIGVTNYTSNGSTDIFIQKLDSTGGHNWTNTYGGTSSDYGEDLVIDGAQNIYITGSFQESVDFDPSAITEIHNSNGWTDFLIQKLDTAGNMIWTQTYGGDSRERGLSIEYDPIGSLYVTGDFHEVVDFDPTNSISNFTTNGAYDVYIQKIDTAGNYIWTKTFGGIFVDYGTDMHVSAKGEIHVTGIYQSTVDFDPNIGVHEISSNGWWDIFILNLNSDGDFQWVKSVGGTGTDSPHSIVMDDDENIFVTGSFTGMADFNPDETVSHHTSNGSRDCFILKLTETLGIVNNVQESNVLIFPNPTNNLFTIKYPENMFTILKITDSNGSLLFESVINSSSTEINLENYKAGIYYVQLIGNNHSYSKSVVKL